MRGTWKLVCAALSIAFVAACGGSSEVPPPAPLAKHFDEMYIASIPVDQQQSVVASQHDWNVARMEAANAQTRFDEVTTQLAIARNNVKAAQLQIDNAMSQKKSAEQSQDTNRINQAQRDLHTAEDAKKAATARVKYLSAYRTYVKLGWRLAQENMYWREAQYEAAKAQIAQQHNIAPRGIAFDAFPRQLKDRKGRLQAAQKRADASKQKVITARDAWLKVQKAADTEGGHESALWDPMAPESAPTTAGTSAPGPGSVQPAGNGPASAGGGTGAGTGAGSSAAGPSGGGAGTGTGSGSAAGAGSGSGSAASQ